MNDIQQDDAREYKYCVYLTLYFGSLLPSRYIGSTSVKKVQIGYNGSVVSKKYKRIYTEEQRRNKHLFKTRILSTHETSHEARAYELSIQQKYNVVKSNRYMNMAYASVNGYFGTNNSGEYSSQYGLRGKLNPKYGKKQTCEHVENARQTRIRKKRPKQSAVMKGRMFSDEHKAKISNSMKNKPKTQQHKNSMLSSEAWLNRDKTRKAVFIEGVYYHTLKEASVALSISSYLIKKMIEKGTPSYSYTERLK